MKYFTFFLSRAFAFIPTALILIISSMAFTDPPVVRIKKLHHDGEFLFEHFLPFEQNHPDYQALLFTYADDRYKSLLIPVGIQTTIDDDCPAAFSAVALNDHFTVTGNDGFQYQANEKEQGQKNHFHFGMTRIYAHKPFSDYQIVIKLNDQTWAFRAHASDSSRYIFDDAQEIESMQQVLGISPFVLTSSNNLLHYLFDSKDEYANFSHLINLFCMALGPEIVQFYPIDERNFFVQSEFTYINCLGCSVTCYDDSSPLLINGGLILSGRDCKIYRPPVDDDDDDPPPPPPPPPQPVDPLQFMIQNYPARVIYPPPDIDTSSTESSIPIDPIDDAWHTALYRPCKGDIDVSTIPPSWGAKSDSSFVCNDTDSTDSVENYFYLTKHDTSGICCHEMFETTPDGVFLRRELLGVQCSGVTGNYRHHHSFKWLPRYVYPDSLFIAWSDTWAWYSPSWNDLSNQCQQFTPASGTPGLCHEEQPHQNDQGEATEVNVITMEIPDPSNSSSPDYCNYKCSDYRDASSSQCQCADGQIKIIINNNYPDAGVWCFGGDNGGNIIQVKAIQRIQHLGGGGTADWSKGSEVYYYGRDYDNSSIAYGLVKYECTPPACGTHFTSDYISTKYYPDLKPAVPINAEEGH